MKKTVKTLVFITIFLLSASLLSAQLKLSSIKNPNPSVAADIKNLLLEYPNHFGSLAGELREEQVQSATYTCKCEVSGAEETAVIRYSSGKNTVYSVESVILTTDGFDKAKQKFRSLYSQLNGLSVSPGNGRTYQLKGAYNAPAEESKFTSVIFLLDKAEDGLKKINVEISLRFYVPMEWKVVVLVYEREREDDEKGVEREVSSL